MLLIFIHKAWSAPCILGNRNLPIVTGHSSRRGSWFMSKGYYEFFCNVCSLSFSVQAPLYGVDVMKQRLHVRNFTNTLGEAVLLYNNNDANFIAKVKSKVIHYVYFSDLNSWWLARAISYACRRVVSYRIGTYTLFEIQITYCTIHTLYVYKWKNVQFSL